MGIVGLHQNEWHNDHLDFIRRQKPTAHLILDPSDGEVAAVKGASGATDVVTRFWERDQDVHNEYIHGDPVAAGRRWAGKVLANRGKAGKFNIVVNEPPCTVEALRRQAQAEVAYMMALDASGTGLKACIGAFSGGNLQHPAIDGGASIRAYEPAFRYAAAHGHGLGLHLYFVRPARGGATPSGAAHNPNDLALRWRNSILPWMRQQGIPIPAIYVLEFGFDAGFAKSLYEWQGGEDVGWKIPAPWGYGDTEEGARLYAADCLWYATEIAKDAEVKGILLYCAGDNGTHMWRSFMVDGYLLRYMAGMAFPNTTTTQPPANPNPPPQGYAIDTSRVSPNSDDRPAGSVIDTVVLHHTGGGLVSSLNWLCNPNSGVSTHYLIGRAGKIYRLVDEEKRAWHSGNSVFMGKPDTNDYSIGIELENAGTGNAPYPAAQLDALVWLLKDLKTRRAMKRERVTTHAVVALPSGRKNDPKGLNVDAVLSRVYDTTPPPVVIDWRKIVWQGEDAMRAEEREGRTQNADWIRRNWVEPAIKERDK